MAKDRRMVSILGTATEFRQLSEAVRFALSDHVGDRRVWLVLSENPGGGRTWSVASEEAG